MFTRYKYKDTSLAAAAAVQAAAQACADFHTKAAAEFFNMPIARVTAEQRELAKLRALAMDYGTKKGTTCLN